MIDIKFLRAFPEKVKENVKNRHLPSVEISDIDKIIDLDKARLDVLKEVESHRALRNSIADKIARETNDSEKKRLSIEGASLKKELKKKEDDLKILENQIEELSLKFPNMSLEVVPVGEGEKDNVVVRTWGEPRKFDFKPLDHVTLGRNLHILNFDDASKVAGANFYYLENEGALLELALVRFAFDLLMKEGFTPVITPDLAKSRFYLGTGYLPRGSEAQTFEISNHDLGLVATAEVTLAGRHADSVIDEEDLPIKYIGYSHCFRQEAGSYGKYSKGLFRVHQFTKAEMFVYCMPEESNRYHELLLSMEEKFYQALKIPHRVVEMCTGDLGSMAARKFDIEAWMPEREDYGEVTSTSNCTDYQARNLNIKYKKKDGEIGFVHMLNGTGCATSRTIIAILDNYQQSDGTISVPEVLRPYMGIEKIGK